MAMDSVAWAVPPAATPAAVQAVEGAAVTWPSAGLPVVLPLSALPLAAQGRLAARDDLLPVDRRVALLLAAERRDEAFALACRAPRPLGAQGRLELELAAWAGRELVRLGLPGARGAVLVVGDDPRGSAAGELRGALGEVRDLLDPLPWSRWAGPVVVFLDGAERGIPPGGVVRPALPLLQLPPGPQLRTAAAAAFARLALDLSAAPAGGWPPWLRAGCAELARARSAGEGPSPRAMAARRAAAGPAGLTALFTAPEPDPALCGALVAALLAPARRGHFGNLLDLLRQGASPAGAIRVAYGLEVGEL